MNCPNCGSSMRVTKKFRPFYCWEDECTYYERVDVAKCKRCDITNTDGEWDIPEHLNPTEKQLRTVAFIENRLDVSYEPEVKLKSTCREFISKYFEQAKQTELPPHFFTEEDCNSLGLDESMFY